MSDVDTKYRSLLCDIKNKGELVSTRNSVVLRAMNLTMKFDTTPLISVRRTAWKTALREMEWFLSGSNNINDLHSSVHKWWTPWANEDGTMPNTYGRQLRNAKGTCDIKGAISVDQIANVIYSLKHNPFSRRNVITTWNAAEMVSPATNITNCHNSLSQFMVDTKNKVHMTMVQRSADMMLGVPHNLIQSWALLMYVCHHSGREVGSLTWFGTDCHVYDNHLHMVDKIFKHDLDEINTPDLVYTPTSDDFKVDDFSLTGKYEPVIKKSLEMTV